MRVVTKVKTVTAKAAAAKAKQVAVTTTVTSPTPYRAEILTADRDGLQGFIEKITAIRKVHPQTRRFGTKGTGGLRGATIKSPICATGIPATFGTTGSLIAEFIGPLNRTIVPSRVEAYKVDMAYRDWWFSPDPIVVTAEGDIINGQHRLMAAEEVVRDEIKDSQDRADKMAEYKQAVTEAKKAKRPAPEAPKIAGPRTKPYPQFVVVWGVDKMAALLMDEARRSATDRRDIALRYAASHTT